jgi:hypothetical protein
MVLKPLPKNYMKIKYTKEFNRIRTICLLVCTLAISYSCIDKEDFESIKGVEWSGAYALPILNSSMTLKDLLPEDDSLHLREETDGLIYFEYNEKVLNYDIRDYFKIPSRSLNKNYLLPDIKLPAFTGSKSLSLQDITGKSTIVAPFAAVTPAANTFDFPAFQDVVYVTFSQGTLSLKAVNNASATLLFTVTLSNSDNSAIGTKSFTVPGNGGSDTKSFPLAGVTVRGQIKMAINSVSSTGTGTLNPASIIQFSTSMSSDAKGKEGEIILQEDVKISVSEPVDFGLSPEQLHEILLKDGNFSYSISSGINYPSEAIISLPTFRQNATAYSKTIQLQTLGTGEANDLSLSNQAADLTTLSPAYNRFPINIDITCRKSSSTFKWKSTDQVNVQIAMDSLNFKHIKGFFGEQLIPLEENSFKIGLFEKTLNGTNISLKGQSIYFNVYNDYGVPLTLDFKEFEGSNENTFLDILTSPNSPFPMSSPALFGDPAPKTKVEVTNAAELYQLNPSLITYQLDATLNKNILSGNNFLTDTSKVTVEINAKIPLWGKAGNIVLEDTMENSIEGDIEEAEVQYIKLKAKITNEFPIDAKVQIYLADENYMITDSLFAADQVAFVTSSSVTIDGDLVKAGEYDKTIEVNKAKFGQLIKAPFLIIRGNLATSESASKDVKIKSNYKLDVKVGLQTKLDVRVNL